MPSPRITPGQAAAEVLRGAWRRTPTVADRRGGTWEAAVPVLADTGAAALAARALGSALPVDTSASAVLEEHAALGRLRAAVRQQHAAEAARALSAAGIPFLIVKGPTLGRLYPDPLLRPSGDVDAAVRAADLERARAALAGLEGRGYATDLQALPSPDLDRPFARVYARRRRLSLGAVEAPALGAEDELRLLALHFWRHQGWRPLWLCDVAAALEHRPDGFDWDLCLQGSARARQWMLFGLALAGRLLDADLRGTPAEACADELPEWVVEAVLARWSDPERVRGTRWRGTRTELAGLASTDPRRLREVLRRRARDPLQAVLERELPFGRRPDRALAARVNLESLARFTRSRP